MADENNECAEEEKEEEEEEELRPKEGGEPVGHVVDEDGETKFGTKKFLSAIFGKENFEGKEASDVICNLVRDYNET